MNILVFGDNIGLGLWDENGGWVGRLTDFLVKKSIAADLEEDYEIYNLGVSGDTTEELVERFEFETRQRIGESETAIIFAVGINDSEYCHSTGQMKVPVEKFRQNLKHLINLAGKYSKKIACIGLTPVDEVKVDPIPWAADFSYRNEFIRQYDEIIKEICRKTHVVYFELFDRLLKSGYAKTLIDGVHPSNRGHELIFKIIGYKLLNSLQPDSGRRLEQK